MMEETMHNNPAMRELTEAELKLVSGGASADNNGFDENTGQGNLNNENVQDPPNPGTAKESGPKGVLKNNNTDNPNYTIDLPGKNR
jgi:hypothetical protein